MHDGRRDGEGKDRKGGTDRAGKDRPGREGKDREGADPGRIDDERTNALTGLAPTEARDWLELQRVFAWHPQIVGDPIRAGVSPRRILRERSAQPPLMPASRGLASTGRDSGRQARRLEELGVRVLPLTDPGYPRCLETLTDAPPVLLVRGGFPMPGSDAAIAIVGARAATQSARAIARRLARELAAAGFVIVSGLARGIDAEAHRGALEAGGRTLGVLACGPDRIYPPEHRNLAEEIIRSGAILSEMPPGVPPRRSHFPLRNRIISGLCQAVIVVEARRRSGSLITVRHALEQGREVFVVPGSAEGPFAEGSNRLLRDGARAILCAADAIEDLGGRAENAAGPAFARTDPPLPAGDRATSGEDSDAGARLLECLRRRPATRDALLIQSGWDPGRLASVLLELELAGRIVLERDGRFHATWE